MDVLLTILTLKETKNNQNMPILDRYLNSLSHVQLKMLLRKLGYCKNLEIYAVSSLSWLVDNIASFSSIIILFQGYRNRNNLIGRRSGSYNFLKKNKKSLILAHLKDFYQFTNPFHEFELLSGASQL